MGLPSYLTRLVPLVAAWTQVTVLDLPGFGAWRRGLACAPTISAMARAAAEWLRAQDGPLVLAGRSTGAQAALRAAVEEPAALHRLVLIGPSFDPATRTRRGLLRALPRSYSRDAPGQLVRGLPDLLRAGSRLVPLVRSGQADRPEALAVRLRMPLVVAAGAQDRIAPGEWTGRLAAAAPRGSVAVLPGSRNVPWTHACAVDELLHSAASPL